MPGRWLAACAAAAILVAGCGGDDEDETARTTPGDDTQAVTTAGDAEGRDAYLAAGCDSCHGEDAEGTKIGPALAGHSEENVVRQVRSPLGQMPSYSRAQVSDEDLQAIADYIVSLAPEAEHIEPVELSDLAATHHWLALSAIDAGNTDDAVHHVDHVIALVKGDHRAAVEEAKEHLEAGETHAAEHLVEEMLAGTAKPDLTPKQLHVRLALAAVEIRNRKGAKHHTRHLLALARGEDRREAEMVLAALEEDDLHDAQHGLQELLGQTPHE